MNPYFPPPEGYRPPRNCVQCHQMIMFGPVIGGVMWKHLTASDHHVVMRKEGYWDTRTGEIVHGNPIRRGGFREKLQV